MRISYSFVWSLAALVVVVSGIALAQDANQNRTLIVNGQPVSVPVIQMNGRSYVDLEALTRAANGSLSFSGNQIALTLPGSSAVATAAPASAAAPAPAANPGFSPAFLKAGIEQMATVREWHTALAAAIQNGTPVAANWLAPYQNQAATNLRLASVAIQTNSDRRAFQLLSNEFQNMAKLADKYITARNNMTYVSPDVLQNDDLNQRIVGCGHSLGSMAASGQFVDDGSCN
ncbi:MAG TPA: hypothetical protein VNO32_41235 [Candidatus Acidoferrum sp.]|jgi:hypothetical protein|nr:hypothetical protein [Candidatus Acidoferrum sp.]